MMLDVISKSKLLQGIIGGFAFLILFVLILAFIEPTHTACSSKEAVKDKEAVKEAVKEPEPEYKYMTNDEIITETHKCEAAGLDADALTIKGKADIPVVIVCTPRAHKP